MLNVQGIEIALFSLVAFAIGYIPVKRLSSTYGATKSSLLILIFGIVPLAFERPEEEKVSEPGKCT